MKYGHASDFEEGSEQGLAEISGKLTAEEVIKWLSKRLNTYVTEHASSNIICISCKLGNHTAMHGHRAEHLCLVLESLTLPVQAV